MDVPDPAVASKEAEGEAASEIAKEGTRVLCISSEGFANHEEGYSQQEGHAIHPSSLLPSQVEMIEGSRKNGFLYSLPAVISECSWIIAFPLCVDCW